jgi:hypothetical protein
MATKRTSVLNKAASDAASDDSLYVVLELKEMDKAPAPATASRAEQIQLNKQYFAQYIQLLKDKIASLGGEVLDQAWLNSTISARVPKHGLEVLEHDDRVQSIDLPHAIERE